MTDKVQKILSEIATRKLCTMDEHMAFYNDNAKEDYRLLSEIEKFIKASQEDPQIKESTKTQHVKETCKENGDSLTQEPVSEDLEEAACNYGDELDNVFVAGIDDDNTVGEYATQAFKDGAQWHKDQMMSKAVDIEVKVDAGGYPYIPQIELYDYCEDIPLAKEGDKYNVVLIKED